MSYNITNTSIKYKIINGKGSWLAIESKDNRNTKNIIEFHKNYRRWGKIPFLIKNRTLYKIYLLLPDSTLVYRQKMYGFKRKLMLLPNSKYLIK